MGSIMVRDGARIERLQPAPPPRVPPSLRQTQAEQSPSQAQQRNDLHQDLQLSIRSDFMSGKALQDILCAAGIEDIDVAFSAAFNNYSQTMRTGRENGVSQRCFREAEVFLQLQHASHYLRVAPLDASLQHWLACVTPGSSQGLRRGGKFYFHLLICPELNYPFSPPLARFITKAFHPNIDYATGAICLDVLAAQWSPAIRLDKIVLSIAVLLMDDVGTVMDVDDPVNAVAAQLFRSSAEQYEKIVRLDTRNQATKHTIFEELSVCPDIERKKQIIRKIKQLDFVSGLDKEKLFETLEALRPGPEEAAFEPFLKYLIEDPTRQVDALIAKFLEDPQACKAWECRLSARRDFDEVKQSIRDASVLQALEESMGMVTSEELRQKFAVLLIDVIRFQSTNRATTLIDEFNRLGCTTPLPPSPPSLASASASPSSCASGITKGFANSLQNGCWRAFSKMLMRP